MTDSPQKPTDDSTGVDLGEDLLYENAPDQMPVARETEGEDALFASTDDPQEQLRNAAILLNEGFIEDAKRVLRKLMVRDPTFVVARDRLEEIHDLELKQILSERERTGFLDRRKKPEPWVSPDEVLKKLDEDLQLGLSTGIIPSLFPDRASVRDFAVQAEGSLSGATARDRMDIGIAFLEMGLHEAAIPQFELASNALEFRMSATSLLGWTYIGMGRPLDSIMALEPLVNDSDIERADKVDLFYVLARACEALEKREDALGWYRQVQSVERQYRDTEERVRRLNPRKSR